MLPSVRFFSNFTSRSIITGKFNYKESFQAFLKGTNQKKHTTMLVGTFVDKLRKEQFLFHKKMPLNVVDIGCADSSSCLKYLEEANHTPGFNYFGVDILEEFAVDARKLLSASPMIKKFNIFKEDAFQGNLSKIQAFYSVPFHLIFISHSAYGIKKSQCSAFIEDILSLLSDEGVALMLHENSFDYYRERYGNAVVNIPQLLEETTRAINPVSFQYIEFSSKLNFKLLTKELWEAFKYPQLYKEFQRHDDFVDTLEKLAFIVQRDFTIMEKEGCLANYIDEVKEAIIKNNNCLYITTHLQTIASPKNNFSHKISKALQEVEKEYSGLVANSEQRNFGLTDLSFPRILKTK